MTRERSNSWCIEQDSYTNLGEGFYESLFSLGNGYMSMRGFQEEDEEKLPHERSQFIAGVFDYIDTDITDMVNTPNYLHTTIKVNDEGLRYDEDSITAYSSILDMQRGILTRSMIWENSQGQQTKIEKERFISLDDLHIACMRYTITPLNYSGNILFETGIDGGVRNNPVNDDQMKVNNSTIKILNKVDATVGIDGGYLKMSTQTRREQIAQCYSLAVDFDHDIIVESSSVEEDDYIGSRYIVHGEAGHSYTFIKYISVYTSRDGIDDIDKVTVAKCEEAVEMGYAQLTENHQEAWAKKWYIADIEIEGSLRIQQAIRYNIYQLIQTNAEHDYRVSIGARGIMHGRYKGCYFWDTEIFMLPFFLYTNPDAAKNLLLYRYHTLEGARDNARAKNLEGIKYPWMSSADGKEQCESWDTGACEIHINGDVPYAIHHYYQATGDQSFIIDQGAEIYIETARYWSSRFSYDGAKDIYNMLFVKGPNEYGGVTLNNTYTTYMAIHNLYLAIESINLLKKEGKWKTLARKLNFHEDEIAKWQKIMNKAVIHYDEGESLYIEDQHFFDLEPITLAELGDETTPLYEKICFDRLQRFRVLKQADVIQLMTLFPKAFTEKEKLVAWETYEPITLHDSTLSYGTHALFAASVGLEEEAWKYFEKSITLDVEDIMGNTDREGIHSASLGISWQAIIFGFAGLIVEEDVLSIYPRMPQQWKKMNFKIVYRKNIIEVSVRDHVVELQLSKESPADAIDITVWDECLTLVKGRINLANKPEADQLSVVAT